MDELGWKGFGTVSLDSEVVELGVEVITHLQDFWRW
jgi:hypothetical protein